MQKHLIFDLEGFHRAIFYTKKILYSKIRLHIAVRRYYDRLKAILAPRLRLLRPTCISAVADDDGHIVLRRFRQLLGNEAENADPEMGETPSQGIEDSASSSSSFTPISEAQGMYRVAHSDDGVCLHCPTAHGMNTRCPAISEPEHNGDGNDDDFFLNGESRTDENGDEASVGYETDVKESVGIECGSSERGSNGIGNSEIGNSEIGNSEIGNSEIGNSEIDDDDVDDDDEMICADDESADDNNNNNNDDRESLWWDEYCCEAMQRFYRFSF